MSEIIKLKERKPTNQDRFDFEYQLKLKDEEIERLNKEIIHYQSGKRFVEMLNEKNRLKNITKEAREYIQDRYDGEVLTHTFDKDNVKELLEILDKVEEKK